MATELCVDLEIERILQQIHKDAMYLFVSSAGQTVRFLVPKMHWLYSLKTARLSVSCAILFLEAHLFDTMKYLCYASGSYLVTKTATGTISLKFCTWSANFDFFIININGLNGGAVFSSHLVYPIWVVNNTLNVLFRNLFLKGTY